MRLKVNIFKIRYQNYHERYNEMPVYNEFKPKVLNITGCSINLVN